MYIQQAGPTSSLGGPCGSYNQSRGKHLRLHRFGKILIYCFHSFELDSELLFNNYWKDLGIALADGRIFFDYM